MLRSPEVKDLLAGYRRFRRTGWPQQRANFESLASGQSPKAVVIACIDSRVDPAMIFDAPPGQLLTIRNVANLVPPYQPDAAYHGTSSALEFGVCALEVPQIIVLGHGGCGGVQALLTGAPQSAPEFVGPWMQIAAEARERALAATSPGDAQLRGEYEVVKVSLENLLTFPWVAERVKAGRLILYGAWFAIRTGELMLLQPDGTFALAEGLPVPG
jgi:carbonic anhydrase